MTDWHQCYAESWRGDIVDEAFTHPAKMSRGLLSRILAHAFAEGWICKGDAVADPFGGIGSTGILGAYAGLRVTCVELEPRFVALAEENFALHRDKWQLLGLPQPRIVQGDSRRLTEVVREAAALVVSSPPYADISQSGGTKGLKSHGTGITQGEACFSEYGKSKGQLGAMKPGDVDAVISSPPFAGVTATQDPNFLTTGEQGKRIPSKSNHADYGETPGQLGRQKGDTFWTAAREIVAQCHAILRPGGHAIWVCKDFVRKGKRVQFSDDWLRLCEAAGFRLVCRHRAMLVREEQHADLFAGTVTKTKSRKSFFRRLAEKKGSPPIDHEDVICLEASP